MAVDRAVLVCGHAHWYICRNVPVLHTTLAEPKGRDTDILHDNYGYSGLNRLLSVLPADLLG